VPDPICLNCGRGHLQQISSRYHCYLCGWNGDRPEDSGRVEEVRAQRDAQLRQRAKVVAERERQARAEKLRRAELLQAERQREEQRAELLRAEQQRGEQRLRRERKLLKEDALKRLRASVEHEFLGTDQLWQSSYSGVVSEEELRSLKAEFVQRWFRKLPALDQPDAEQAAAIATTSNNVQVVARAGSGKTRTLINRALFLQQHCGVEPHQMLLLAFNRKAAEEMVERLQKAAKGRKVPQAMTFHALAYGLVHPSQQLLHDDGDNLGLTDEVQSIINDHLRVPKWAEKVRSLMRAHWREDWERIVRGGHLLSQEDFLRYRRSLPRVTLHGGYVKSWGEKLIADFLFEHSIPYQYERNFWWGERNYRPDFTLFGDKKSVVIEYFGRSGDRDYDEMSERKREYWRSRRDWSLIELCPDDQPDVPEKFRARLRRLLEANGFRCIRRSDEEIWEQISERAVDHFSRAMTGFIQRCRKLRFDAASLAEAIRRHKVSSTAEGQFLEIANQLYPLYLQRLAATNQEDFDGLLQRAEETINLGRTHWDRGSGQGDLRDLKFLLIDEHQDFSAAFDHLVRAIKSRNPDMLVYCVGDDWQAINRFAGSDLKYFTDFPEQQRPATRLHLATNYRSPKQIVEAGNAVMRGRGVPALPRRNDAGQVLVADLSRFFPTALEAEYHQGDIVTPAVVRLILKAADAGQSVVLLSRRNEGLPWFVNRDNGAQRTLDAFLQHVRGRLPKGTKVTASTAHSFKGKEEDCVIVLDAIVRSYPLIHPDWVFTRVFGNNVKDIVEEERRLFHVAVTRAKGTLVLITESGADSPFLEDIRAATVPPLVDWAQYPPPLPAAPRVIVKVANQDENTARGTLEIRELLQAEGFKFITTPLLCWAKSIPEGGFNMDRLQDSSWGRVADRVEVRICDYADTALQTFMVAKGTWQLLADRDGRPILTTGASATTPSPAVGELLKLDVAARIPWRR